MTAPNLTFQGLPGIEGQITGGMASSASALIKGLSKNCRVMSAAGDEGCVTLWIDDAGQYWACFQRHWSTIACIETAAKADLRPFIDKWLPATRDLCSLADATRTAA